TSDDSSKLLLSTAADVAGTPSITLFIPAGLNHTQDFTVHGLASSGTVTYTITATGFGTAHGSVNLAQSGIIIAGPFGIGVADFPATIGSSTTLTLYSGQLDSNGVFATAQQVRAGFSASVNITSSNTTVGTL